MKPYRPYFQQVLQRYYPGQLNTLIMETEHVFQQLVPDIAFSKLSGNPMDRRMEISAYFLAVITVLDKRNEGYDRIREILLEIARKYVKPKNQWEVWMKKVPAKILPTALGRSFFKWVDKKLQKRNHSDGFVLKILTDKKDTLGLGYGVDILECGICKLFSRHQMQKYAPILCEIDYITSSMAGLTLVRSGTIANGAAKCDFRFRKNV